MSYPHGGAGFQNPPVGNQGILVRPAIKSPNYVLGISGWIINRDGTAEFNNVTVRGTIVGSTIETATSGARIVIDNTGTMTIYNSSGVAVIVASASLQDIVIGPSGSPQVTLAGSGTGEILISSGGTHETAGSIVAAVGLKGAANEFSNMTIAGEREGGIQSYSLIFNSGAADGSTKPSLQIQDGHGTSVASFQEGVNNSSLIAPLATGPESWHDLTLNANGRWTNRGAGFPHVRYQFLVSPPSCVMIQGEVTFTDNGSIHLGNGSIIGTLPLAYTPGSEQPCNVVGIYGGSGYTITANQTPRVIVDTSGNVSVWNITTTANGNTCGIQFNSIYSLN